MRTSFQYSEYVGLMYQKGYYVENYNINLMSNETCNIEGKILIVPNPEEIYIFTGITQKIKTLSEPTEFRLILFDKTGKEFHDNDFIMLSRINIINKIPTNLFTRNYATWKFGISFERGILLDSDKYLIFQAQKPIEKFDIDIINIDLFRRKDKRKEDRMLWLD